MKINPKYSKPIKIKAEYPIFLFNNFLNKKTCNLLYKEIKNLTNYDDIVMNGRHRVNKGSKTFKRSLKKSPHLSKLYNSLNSLKSYRKIKGILLSKSTPKGFQPILQEQLFSKDSYGEQKFNLFDYIKKIKLVSSFLKDKINLDMDFSKSKRGYFRNAHRDRDTRVISFLLYLNTINKKDGGQFEVYRTKQFSKNPKTFSRFPNKKEVIKTNKFPPVSGQMFIFLSSPNSYHGVSKFTAKNKERVFIYGSYSLNKKVEWLIN